MKAEWIVLYAHWCPKCSMMMPIVDEIEQLYRERMTVVRIDIEEDAEAAKAYSVAVVPTFIVRMQGVEIGRMAGIIGEESLKRRLEELLDTDCESLV